VSYRAAFPIDGLQLIDEYRAADRQSGRNHDLKRIPFYFGRDRTHRRQICFRVERSLSENKGGTRSSLLASQCGVEVEVDKIAALWNVSRRG
jgi:hypothetical protein